MVGVPIDRTNPPEEPAHAYEHVQGRADRGMSGMHWYRCSCGKSGTAWESEQAARMEWQKHLQAAKNNVVLVIHTSVEGEQQFASAVRTAVSKGKARVQRFEVEHPFL